MTHKEDIIDLDENMYDLQDQTEVNPYDNMETDENGQFTLPAPFRPEQAVYIRKNWPLIYNVGITSIEAEKILDNSLVSGKIEKRSKSDYLPIKQIQKYQTLKDMAGTDFSDGYITEFSSAELMKILKLKRTHHFYDVVKRIVNTPLLKNAWSIMYDDGKKWARTDLIIGTAYMNGQTYIKWNEDAIHFLKPNVDFRYTQLADTILNGFESLEALKLYQILKKNLQQYETKCKKNHVKIENEVPFEMTLSEIKFYCRLIQVDNNSVDPHMMEVRDLISNRRYDEAEALYRMKYKTIRDQEMTTRVLPRCSREINGWKGVDMDKSVYEGLCNEMHPTDLHFRYERIFTGRGGKLTSIRFFVSRDTVNPDDDELASMIDEVRELLKEEQLEEGELRKICVAAKYDVDKIKDAYDAAKEYREENVIESITAFLLTAVKKGYKPNTRKDTEDKEEEIIPTHSEAVPPEGKRTNSFEIDLKKVPAVHRQNVEMLYELGPGYTEIQYIYIIVTILKKIHRYKIENNLPTTYREGNEDKETLIIADYFMEYEFRASANIDQIKSTKFAYLLDCIQKDYLNLFDDIAGRNIG